MYFVVVIFCKVVQHMILAFKVCIIMLVEISSPFVAMFIG